MGDDPSNGVAISCEICGRAAGSTERVTWLMSIQEIALEDYVSTYELMVQRQGMPSVLVLPDDGGLLPYFLAPYCDSCLNNCLKEYEEHQTPPSEMTRAEFQERIKEISLTAGWELYELFFQYIAPHGYPNLALIKDDELVLPNVEGDVTSRNRAFHPPGHMLITSPEVPEDMREELASGQSEEDASDKIALLYMDEKYSDTMASPSMQVTSLCGILIAADKFISFRDQFFGIVPGFQQGANNFPMDIHASSLFPERPDEEHFQFYCALVSLINEFRCRVYRRGFNFIPDHQLLRRRQSDLLGLCFRSMLISVDDFEGYGQIWPVMETDHSKSLFTISSGLAPRRREPPFAGWY